MLTTNVSEIKHIRIKDRSVVYLCEPNLIVLTITFANSYKSKDKKKAQRFCHRINIIQTKIILNFIT